jgi:hypothetical protein
MDLLLFGAGSADVPASIYNAVCLSPGAPPFFPAGRPAPVSTFSTPPLKGLHQFDMEWTTVHVLGLSSVADPNPGPPDPRFWASWIRILLSPSKNSKKNLDSYCFMIQSYKLVMA